MPCLTDFGLVFGLVFEVNPAKTISAFYDCSCGSGALFAGREISKSPSYEKHLNKYSVIFLDMTNIMGKTEPGT